MDEQMKEDYKLLRINLSQKRYSREYIEEGLLKKYIGGKGLASYFLLKEVPPHIDPLGPENKLIFTCGPLSGTIFPTGNRYGVLFKAPLMGTYGECYSGGRLAERFRASGYFMIIIEGVSEEPVYLYISDKKIEFRDAYHLWGMDTHETYYTLIPEKTNKMSALMIGPAGENMVKFATIQNDLYHSLARGGPGAVMGSKKLKAIVFEGNYKVRLNTKPEFKAFVKKIGKRIRSLPHIYGPEGTYQKYGTASIVTWANEFGCFPTEYFYKGYSEYYGNFDAEYLINNLLVKREGCWNCPFRCRKYIEVKEGPFQCEIEGPEYETIASIGGMSDIRSMEAIAKINDFCDRMGLDTISAGSLYGLAVECKKKGRIPGIEKLNIGYNKPLALLRFLRDLIKKGGIPGEFANGTKYIEQKYDLKDIAFHVKGLDFAGYDPRAFRGFALSYGVSPEGPTHLRSVFHSKEIKMPNRLEYEGKPAMMASEEDRMAIIDSLITCKFIRDALEWEYIPELYNSIFNEHYDLDAMHKIAGSIINLSRKFNNREGFNRNNDYLPIRAYTEPLPQNFTDPYIIDREKYDKMLDEYYQLRNWTKDGIVKD
ncbi:MAG: aldehyde ferredoxin oxidoreductase family protein [Promethearchaeota archaeon]